MIDTEKNIVMQDTTKVISHSSKSSSVRSVIPQKFAQKMDVKPGDSVQWTAVTKNDITYILVEKVK